MRSCVRGADGAAAHRVECALIYSSAKNRRSGWGMAHMPWPTACLSSPGATKVGDCSGNLGAQHSKMRSAFVALDRLEFADAVQHPAARAPAGAPEDRDTSSMVLQANWFPSCQFGGGADRDFGFNAKSRGCGVGARLQRPLPSLFRRPPRSAPPPYRRALGTWTPVRKSYRSSVRLVRQ